MTPGPVAVVTGASSGIGTAFARSLVRQGEAVVLVARRQERLVRLAEELGGQQRALTLPLDLTRPEAPERVLAELAERGLHADLLVNNAGLGETGAFQQQPLPRVLEMIDLNMRALVELTHRVLPGMLERGRGRLINVASMGAFQPVPFLNVYAASKSFVLSFSEALATELEDTGVRVQVLCPGYTDTEFFDVSHTGAGMWVNRMPRMTPEEVAEFSLRALKRGRLRAVPGLGNRLQAFLTNFTPGAVSRRVGRALYRPR